MVARGISAGAGGRAFSLGDLLAWLRDGNAARPAGTSAKRQVFATVTMSSLPAGSPPMEQGGLFVAVKGEKRDGHDFVANAFENGAIAALVNRVPGNLADAVTRGEVCVCQPHGDVTKSDVPLLFMVDDPMLALQRCAGWWRRSQPARVLGITGSVGKTTTKDLLSAVLAQRGPLVSTRGNFNNELGLPFMLLELTPEHRAAVLEIGISAVGEMEAFARIASPDVAIVTRVAPAHLEGFSDVQTVQREKGQLVAALGTDGVAVLNADDPLVLQMGSRSAGRVATFGEAPDADVRAENVVLRGFEGVQFDLVRHGDRWPVLLPLVGRHFVSCALAAAAAAFEEGCTGEQVAAGLGRPLSGRRLEPLALPSGVTLLDDTYNASPAAMRAALDVLAETHGRRIAVLGDMFEMGAAGPRLHREVGEYVPQRADLLVAVGELSRHLAAAALDGGVETGAAVWLETPEAAAEWLAARLRPGDFVLVKGSRGMRMDRIVAALVGEHAPAEHGSH
ncbi:MAG: UDP-N-acetylmuramoyl-tripeptide--D-alanyl-D-alanine ligase [uncultured Chloroflexi bacterium]|uniref:UDP-N-acetylmuramoyl-tripeptide--D-alanyl-D-alanine ligase n=1 Tax=uncultured Chloroflexota bacterium TaxID=166587 RepID=A0A6J4KM57_9CHLR|nr:MAG: UDP-N-acetylmuramoyl-tripeptide--D-alanyl-D-alanine ligase [uncultured Chloroflexota bacterium]